MPIASTELVKRAREANPYLYKWFTDEEVLDKLVKKYPEYKNYISDYEAFTKKQENVKSKRATYDPTVTAHLKNTWFTAKELGINIPLEVVGIAASVTGSDDLRKMAESYREWSKKKTDEWIANDVELQAYMQWVHDEPMNYKNFWRFDMMMRGVSSIAPSIAMMVASGGFAGTALKAIGAGEKVLKYGKAASQFLSMATLEGSTEMGEALSYLIDKKGVDPKEAYDTASKAAVTYGLLSAPLEYAEMKLLWKFAGVDKFAEKSIVRSLADKITKNKLMRKASVLSALDITEGVQEGAQNATQLMVENVYKKYGGSVEDAFDNFAKDFEEAVKSPETKESFYSAVAGVVPGAVGLRIGSAAFKRFQESRAEEKLTEDEGELTPPEREAPRQLTLEGEENFTPDNYIRTLIAPTLTNQVINLKTPDDTKNTELADLVEKHKTGGGVYAGFSLGAKIKDVIDTFGKRAIKPLSEEEKSYIEGILASYIGRNPIIKKANEKNPEILSDPIDLIANDKIGIDETRGTGLESSVTSVDVEIND